MRSCSPIILRPFGIAPLSISCALLLRLSLKRICIGLDPAVTSREDSAETGIVACGIGTDDHYYVIADRSLIQTPDAWARAA